ncbi:MAG: hypothetical protein EP329_10750 [Deltaproteobacteria bacterium]|nr:MAG: hypothetical protein EP329_10750 [Deltaproteobacteria bacterium]
MLLIVVAAAVGAGWYFDVIPDAYVGVPLGIAVVVGAGGAVWLQVRHVAASPRLKVLGAVGIVLALVVGVWSPWSILGPGGQIAAADIAVDDPVLTIPPVGDGPAAYRVYFHGEPAYGSTSTAVNLTLEARPGTEPLHRLGRLDTQTTKGSGRGGGKEVKRRDLVWPVVADLSAGGRVITHEPQRGTLSWPAHVEVHTAPPSPVLPAVAGGVIALFALIIEATNRRRQRSWLSTLAASAPIFTVLFGVWFAPGHITAAVFGAALVAAVGGTLVSYSLLPLFRMKLAPPAPAET